MSLAIAQAVEAGHAGEVPVGAVIVRDGKVIAAGRNRTIEWNDPSAHAEVVVLREAARVIGTHRMSDLELFVTLEPCAMCSGTIFHSRLARVVFGAPDPKTGCAGSVVDLFGLHQLNHHTRVTGGILSEDCAQLLRAFFKRTRQVQAKRSQPLREDTLRTPSSAFSELNLIPLPSKYFYSSDGFRIHYQRFESENSRKYILCLHDIPYWSYDLVKWIDKLKKLDYSLIIPDLLGCGLSDKPKRKNIHTVSLHARLLKELILDNNFSFLYILAFGSSQSIADSLRQMLESPDIKIIYIDVKDLSNNFFFMSADRLTTSQIKPKTEESRRYLTGLTPEVKSYVAAPFPDRGYASVLAAVQQLSVTTNDKYWSRQPLLCEYRFPDGLGTQALDTVLAALKH